MTSPDRTKDHHSDSEVRQRILATARRLFYAHGILAVGVDTIVKDASVAKSSLYRWFPTKDDLIEAFLRTENDAFWSRWDEVAAAAQSPLEELVSHLDWIERYIAGPRFRGCPFLNASAEFPDPDHQARRVAREHKSELRRRLAALTNDAGIQDADLLADQLVLLIDGAFANSQALGKNGPALHLRAAGEAAIRQKH